MGQAEPVKTQDLFEPMSAPTLTKADRWLAAEYALGVLDGAQLEQAKTRYEQDVLFRDSVDQWHHEFSPMLDDVDSFKPSADVWRAIEADIGPPPATRDTSPGLWTSLVFWRGLSLATSALAIACLAILLFFSNWSRDSGQSLVATLNANGTAPEFVVRYDQANGALLINVTSSQNTQTRVPELWIIPDDGVPRSLGVLEQDRSLRVIIPQDQKEFITDGSILAISLEPQGGSPTGQPTGPVLASGTLLNL